jgi:hypothetical protein
MSHPVEKGRRFQVLLSHNSSDKPAIRELKQLLAAKGITAWLDEDELPPGQLWQPLIEQAIKDSESVAVCVGESGLGPWQDEEMQAALRLAVRLHRPVIPLLLPGAPETPELPLFLANRGWVDARDGFTEEILRKLVWGIKNKPSAQVKPELPTPAPHSDSGISPGRAKNDFCDRLGPDWERLADVLGLSISDKRQIKANHGGAEGRGIWEWLEIRKQLAGLAAACRSINRSDLADALPRDLGVQRAPPGRPR